MTTPQFAVMVTKEELNTLREGCLALDLHWRAMIEAVKKTPIADPTTLVGILFEYEARQQRAATLYARLISMPEPK